MEEVRRILYDDVNGLGDLDSAEIRAMLASLFAAGSPADIGLVIQRALDSDLVQHLSSAASNALQLDPTLTPLPSLSLNEDPDDLPCVVNLLEEAAAKSPSYSALVLELRRQLAFQWSRMLSCCDQAVFINDHTRATTSHIRRDLLLALHEQLATLSPSAANTLSHVNTAILVANLLRLSTSGPLYLVAFSYAYAADRGALNEEHSVRFIDHLLLGEAATSPSWSLNLIFHTLALLLMRSSSARNILVSTTQDMSTETARQIAAVLVYGGAHLDRLEARLTIKALAVGSAENGSSRIVQLCASTQLKTFPTVATTALLLMSAAASPPIDDDLIIMNCLFDALAIPAPSPAPPCANVHPSPSIVPFNAVLPPINSIVLIAQTICTRHPSAPALLLERLHDLCRSQPAYLTTDQLGQCAFNLLSMLQCVVCHPGAICTSSFLDVTVDTTHSCRNADHVRRFVASLAGPFLRLCRTLISMIISDSELYCLSLRAMCRLFEEDPSIASDPHALVTFVDHLIVRLLSCKDDDAAMHSEIIQLLLSHVIDRAPAILSHLVAHDTLTLACIESICRSQSCQLIANTALLFRAVLNAIKSDAVATRCLMRTAVVQTLCDRIISLRDTPPANNTSASIDGAMSTILDCVFELVHFQNKIVNRKLFEKTRSSNVLAGPGGGDGSAPLLLQVTCALVRTNGDARDEVLDVIRDMIMKACSATEFKFVSTLSRSPQRHACMSFLLRDLAPPITRKDIAFIHQLISFDELWCSVAPIVRKMSAWLDTRAPEQVTHWEIDALVKIRGVLNAAISRHRI